MRGSTAGVVMHGHNVVSSHAASTSECFEVAADAVLAVEQGGYKFGAVTGSLTANAQWESYRWFLYPHEAADFVQGRVPNTPKVPFSVVSDFAPSAGNGCVSATFNVPEPPVSTLAGSVSEKKTKFYK